MPFPRPQCVEKVRLRRSFSSEKRCFPLAPKGLPGGKQRKETLLRKAHESAAHVAGFDLSLEGFGPPNLPERFFDRLRPGESYAFPPAFLIWALGPLSAARCG